MIKHSRIDLVDEYVHMGMTEESEALAANEAALNRTQSSVPYDEDDDDSRDSDCRIEYTEDEPFQQTFLSPIKESTRYENDENISPNVTTTPTVVSKSRQIKASTSMQQGDDEAVGEGFQLGADERVSSEYYDLSRSESRPYGRYSGSIDSASVCSLPFHISEPNTTHRHSIASVQSANKLDCAIGSTQGNTPEPPHRLVSDKSRLSFLFGDTVERPAEIDAEKQRLCTHISVLKEEWRTMQLATLDELSALRDQLASTVAQLHTVSAERDECALALDRNRNEIQIKENEWMRELESLKEESSAQSYGMSLVISNLQACNDRLLAREWELPLTDQSNITPDSSLDNSHQLLTLKEQVDRLTEELVSVTLSKSRLEETLTTVQNDFQLNIVNHEADQVRVIEKYELQLAEANELNSQLRYEISATMDKAQREITVLTQEVFSLKQLNVTFAEDCSALQEELREVRDSNVNLLDKIELLNKELENCTIFQQQSFNQSQHDVQKLATNQSEMDENHNEVELLTVRVHELSSLLAVAIESNAVEKNLLRDRIIKLSTQMAEMRDASVTEKTQLVDQLSDLTRRLSITNSDSNEDCCILNDRIMKLSMDLQTALTEKTLLSQQLSAITAKFCEVEETLAIERLTSSDRIAELGRSCSMWDTSNKTDCYIDQLDAKVTSLENELHQKSEMLNSQNSLCRQNYEEYQTKLETLMSERDTLLVTIKKLESELLLMSTKPCDGSCTITKINSLNCNGNKSSFSMSDDNANTDEIPQPTAQIQMLTLQLKECKGELIRLQRIISEGPPDYDRKEIDELNQEIDRIHSQVITDRDRLAVCVTVLNQELQNERKISLKLSEKLNEITPQLTTLEEKEKILTNQLKLNESHQAQSLHSLDELNRKLANVLETSVAEKSVLARRISELDLALQSNSNSQNEFHISPGTTKSNGRRDTKLWFAPRYEPAENEFMRAHRNIAELWARHFQALIAYCRQYGTCNVPRGYISECTVSANVDSKLPLGKWLHTQKALRQAPGRPRLLPERLALLQKLVDEGS